jgi:Rho-binding antiterminator
MKRQHLHTAYQPIACAMHDRLEAIATRGERVSIRYSDADGDAAELLDRIADLYARQGEEFLRTAGGVAVRLDRIESVADLPV